MRCEDCLDDLASSHFLVLEPEIVGDDPDDPSSVIYDEKRLCHDCAGWYREVMEVTE